jgi:heme-degrading monooxygenase HmoA
MFVERAEIPVAAGKEADFAAALANGGLALLAGAKNCSSARLGRGVENPGKFILLLEWDSVESHVAFTKTPEFDQFKALAGPFFAGAPNMEHFEIL